MFSSLSRILSGNSDLPTVSWIKERQKKTLYTPDISLLEKRPFQWLFEYGEAQPKHPEFKTHLEGHVADAPPMAAFTLNDFTCYKQKLGKLSFPVALPEKHFNTHHCQVRGNLIGVRSTRFLKLDEHRQNGVAFQRHRIKVAVPHFYMVENKGTQGLTRVVCEPALFSAWMYIGVPEYWNEVLDNGLITGNLSTYGDLEATIPQYYQFTRRDYDD